MPDINFGSIGKVRLPTKYHGEVTLSQAKWATICAEPERAYYPFNGEKIATTLVSPDWVRHHRKEPTQFFYYKNFPSIALNATTSISPPGGVFFAVILDTSTKRVCTCYPVYRPKPGKEFKPKKSK